ncbi:hypothetical protein ACFVWN_00365 [Nocardiopsis flavescens]|uniref:hypothetical protein n=1 Tax=Nocardiopsis flavescens TaxID=758803 RepID=UPI00364A6521
MANGAGTTLSGIQAERDVLVAGGDITKVERTVRYQQGPSLLRSRAIGRDEIPSAERFSPTGDTEGVRSGVQVLIGPAHTGRRTVGLRTLGTLPQAEGLREFRTPDWDEPDMDRIPADPRYGYLLDLTGTGEALTEQFADDLARYAKEAVAQEHGPLLFILGDEEVGRKLSRIGGRDGVVIREHRRPDAVDVAKRRIRTSDRPDRWEREKWVDGPEGVFHGLVAPDALPSRGCALAEAVLNAADKNDTNALGPLSDWQEQIQDWFSTDVRAANPKGAETRSLRIAAAFLDGQPATAVLNAADALLPQKVRDLFELWGGDLAAPDDRARCSEAGLAWRDGRIYITEDGRKGIDFALIRYLWDRRGSVADRLAGWLAEISAPRGAAEDCLDRLSEVLTEVAVAQGSATVLSLLEEWLKRDAPQRTDFVVDVLQRLTEHEDLGPRVRVVDLRNWAKGSGSSERQRAVIGVCQGRFGENYPEQALMRLRYVAQTARDPELRREAVAAVAERFEPGRNERLAALNVLVDWIEDDRTVLDGGLLFLDLFGGSPNLDGTTGSDPTRGLLTPAGDEGEQALALFRRAWTCIWRQPTLRRKASHALALWAAAVEKGEIPFDRGLTVLSVVSESAEIDEDVDRVITVPGGIGIRLRRDFWKKPREEARLDGERTDVPS